MTSVARELATAHDDRASLGVSVRDRVADAFAEVFSLERATLDSEALLRLAPPPVPV
jgi:hypothetical protein